MKPAAARDHALDVTTQSEVMTILGQLRTERGLAMLFITHDLDLAAAVTDRMAVMYAGMIVEITSSASVHDSALHPYAIGLLRSRPDIGSRSRIQVIPGRPVSAFEAGPGCVFAARCPYAIDILPYSTPAPAHCRCPAGRLPPGRRTQRPDLLHRAGGRP